MMFCMMAAICNVRNSHVQMEFSWYCHLMNVQEFRWYLRIHLKWQSVTVKKRLWFHLPTSVIHGGLCMPWLKVFFPVSISSFSFLCGNPVLNSLLEFAAQNQLAHKSIFIWRFIVCQYECLDVSWLLVVIGVISYTYCCTKRLCHHWSHYQMMTQGSGINSTLKH